MVLCAKPIKDIEGDLWATEPVKETGEIGKTEMFKDIVGKIRKRNLLGYSIWKISHTSVKRTILSLYLMEDTIYIYK